MCWNCKDEVEAMDIRESDLPNLPFKLVKQLCIVPGCNNGIILKDYGIHPFYYWPVKIRYDYKDLSFRGGWLNVGECWVCSKHRKKYPSHHDVDFTITEEMINASIIPHKQTKKKNNFSQF